MPGWQGQLELGLAWHGKCACLAVLVWMALDGMANVQWLFGGSTLGGPLDFDTKTTL